MLQPKPDRPVDRAAVAAAAELYESDTVLWSERQAELLHQAAVGRPPAGIDWTNIIEEIESVGRSLVNAVESLLLQALVHEFKIALWPDAPYVEGWRNESLLFQAQAAGQFTASMRQRIDVSKLVHRAMRAVPQTIDGVEQDSSFLRALDYRASEQVQDWFADPDLQRIRLIGAQPTKPEADLFRDET